MKIKSSLFVITLAVCSNSHAAIILDQKFGAIADATLLTSVTGTRDGTVGVGTGNTSFTYVRVSNGASPTLEFQNPSAFSGSSALLGASTASLTGVGSSGFSAFTVGTLDFSLKTGSLGTNSIFFFGVGTGTTFTENSAFTGAHLTAAYQLVNGVFQVRTGTSGSQSWTSLTPGKTLAANTSYNITVVFNGSASSVSYGVGSIAAGSTDIYLDGTSLGNYDIIDAVDVTGVRFYTTTSGGAFELDNVLLQNTAVMPIPEPNAAALFGALGVLGLLRRRR